jgi:hypothetical protein
MSTVALCILVGVFVACAMTARIRREGVLNSLIAQRKDIDPDEVFRLNYPKEIVSRERFLEIWDQIARRLNVPASRLRVTDRFDMWRPPPFHLHSVLDDLEDYVLSIGLLNEEEALASVTVGELVGHILRQRVEPDLAGHGS